MASIAYEREMCGATRSLYRETRLSYQNIILVNKFVGGLVLFIIVTKFVGSLLNLEKQSV